MILQKIVADNAAGLEEKKRRLPLGTLSIIAEQQPRAIDFLSALQGDGVKLIAEVKKASPSKGVLRPDFDAVALARSYAEGGAAAISVLTESRHFLGKLDYIRDIRTVLGDATPLLRKDFIHDPYQVYESRASGADAILLITAILNYDRLKELLELSHRLGMNCLVEVHNKAELDLALKTGARIIGINNRDLNTFSVDLATTERLRPLIPHDRVVVSESGIKSTADMSRMRRAGVNAVLVGESLVTAPDAAAKIRELLDQDQDLRTD